MRGNQWNLVDSGFWKDREPSIAGQANWTADLGRHTPAEITAPVPTVPLAG